MAHVFQKLPADGNPAPDVSHSTVRDHFVLLAKNQRRAQPVSAGSVSSEHEKKQVEVLRLIHAYRLRGHQASTSTRSACGSVPRLPTCRSTTTV